MAATFNGNPRATIISSYSPNNVCEETELVTFYDELSSLVRSIPKHNMLVVGGDMNAQIGKNGNNKYSLHNTSNRNGQHLTDFIIYIYIYIYRERETDRQTESELERVREGERWVCVCVCVCVCVWERERQTDRQTKRQMFKWLN